MGNGFFCIPNDLEPQGRFLKLSDISKIGFYNGRDSVPMIEFKMIDGRMRHYQRKNVKVVCVSQFN